MPNAPGLFVAANADFRLNSASQPARPGEVLHIYGTGQGAVPPGIAGLWQVDIQLPNNAPTGSAMPLWVESGLASNQIMVAVSQQ